MKTTGQRTVDTALWIITAATLLVLYSPVIIGALFSVVEITRGQVQWGSVTLAWYARLWQNQSIVDAISTTLIVAVVSVAAASLLAIVLALYVEWEGAVAGRWLELVVYLPFVLPPIVTGLSLLIFFSDLGIGRGMFTVAVGHTIFVLAVVYRLVQSRLRALPKSLVEASSDLGATRWQTFRHILWPQMASSVATGAILAFTLSFDETLVTSFLAGDTMTLPLRLWAMMRVGFTPEINALVTLVLLFSIVLTIVVGLRMQPAAQMDED